MSSANLALLLFTTIIAPATSYLIAPHLAPPAVASRHVMMKISGSTLPEEERVEVEQASTEDAQNNIQPADTLSTYGVSSALVGDKDLMVAAQEAAAAAGHADNFSPTEIVVAFNSWKVSLGRMFDTKDEEALALRAFAGNADLISTHLQAAQSALIGSGTSDEEEIQMLSNVDWTSKIAEASEMRQAAEQQRVNVLKGRAVVDEKLKAAVLTASKEEERALLAAQAKFAEDCLMAEAVASRKRSELSQQLAQVAVDEKEARQEAEKVMSVTMHEVRQKTAHLLAAAEADRSGQLHNLKRLEDQALLEVKAAQRAVETAMAEAKRAEDAARAAAAKQKSAMNSASSENQALLSLLQEIQSKAAGDVAKAEQEVKDMQEAVKVANKRAQKAKLAAAAALEDL